MKKLIAILSILIAFTAADAHAKELTEKTPDYSNIGASRTMRWKVRQADLSSMPTAESKGTQTMLEQSINEVEMLQLPEYAQTKAEIEEEQPEATVQMTVAKTETVAMDKAVVFELHIANLLKDPDSIVNPLAVAETLFNKGSYQDAALFFEIALERMEKTQDDTNKAWALYQNANSLHNNDKTEAYKIYHKLLAEYPTSYWTNPARVQQQIIAWYEEYEPNKILEKYASDVKGQ
jgi:TolA-binding protein